MNYYYPHFTDVEAKVDTGTQLACVSTQIYIQVVCLGHEMFTPCFMSRDMF